MTFTKQDLLTFLIGAGIAVGVNLGEALIQLQGTEVADWAQWGKSLGIGTLTAMGRYVATRLPELKAKIPILRYILGP